MSQVGVLEGMYSESNLEVNCKTRMKSLQLISLFFFLLYRLVSGKKRSLNNPHRNVLDGELLNKFAQLGTMERLEVTKKIGTTPAQV